MRSLSVSRQVSVTIPQSNSSTPTRFSWVTSVLLRSFARCHSLSFKSTVLGSSYLRVGDGGSSVLCLCSSSSLLYYADEAFPGKCGVRRRALAISGKPCYTSLHTLCFKRVGVAMHTERRMIELIFVQPSAPTSTSPVYCRTSRLPYLDWRA
jgi:hypothetical protein